MTYMQFMENFILISNGFPRMTPTIRPKNKWNLQEYDPSP